MSKQMVLGSAEWLELQRAGVFDRRPPVPTEPPRPQISPQKRSWMALGLLDYDGAACPYCGQAMQAGTPWYPTRDHVYPRHLGGTRHKDNLLIVCAPCNQAKGAKTLEHFARSLTARRDPRAQRVWDLVRTRPSFPATETGAIIAGWEKARKTADRIAHRARSNGQESAP